MLALLLALPQIDLSSLPVRERTPATADWLTEASSAEAGVFRDPAGEHLVLDNGLVRREFRVEPALACVAFDDLTSSRSLLRAVRPEARLVVDGVQLDVGGLVGQPNHAYLDPTWELHADPAAMRFVGYEVGEPAERFGWKRTRHHAAHVVWPPPGVSLRLDFAMPAVDPEELAANATETSVGRGAHFEDDFGDTAEDWTIHASRFHEQRSSFANEGKVGEIYTSGNSAVFAERAVPEDTRVVEVLLDAGTDFSKSWGPGLAWVFEDRTVKLNLRTAGGPYDAGHAHFGLWDGQREIAAAGGRQKLDLSKPWLLRLRRDATTLHAEARRIDESTWRAIATLTAPAGAPQALRVGKLDLQGGATDHATPGDLGRLTILRAGAYGAIDLAALDATGTRLGDLSDLRVSVHYELYDGIPLVAKWLTVTAPTTRGITVEKVTSEVLAVVEHDSRVETRDDVPLPSPDWLHVETDYAMGGMTAANACRHAVHWVTDPEFTTQVNYLRETPCLLEVRPERGPDQDLAAGETFTSMRTFELVEDGADSTRRSLARARMAEVIAPWVTENPLMMHVRNSDDASVRHAIAQCAEVGFEMLILTFGSGFNIEDDSPANLARWKGLADEAHAAGIQLGGYSLLSSRRIRPDGDNCIHPETGQPGGQIHGSCPALASDWGQAYYRKLYDFFEATGFDLLEHDGPYPGNLDAAARPPLQKGVEDSRWVQWSIAADFYSWCRGRGIYLNTPDWYYLVGSTKCGMGYREVNWSLPRAQQVIHTRQNIFDGTRHKRPSMGWMFVPLTQYHGGGAAATVEPLDEHRDHYRRLLESNLGAGVQACYRGPQLYDTARVQELVTEQVSWYKAHRDILEAPIVHGASRRADGRGVDWMLHADPRLDERGMLCVYNPTGEDRLETLLVDVYYTGARGRIQVTQAGGRVQHLDLDHRHRIALEVEVPAGGMSWYSMR